jgi:hypothetical protein
MKLKKGYQARMHYNQGLQALLAGWTSPAFALRSVGGSDKSTLARKFAATLGWRDSLVGSEISLTFAPLLTSAPGPDR